MSAQHPEDDLDEAETLEVLRRQASQEYPVPWEMVKEHLGL